MRMKGRILKILSFANFSNRGFANCPVGGLVLSRRVSVILGCVGLLLLLVLLGQAIIRVWFGPEELLLVSAGDGSLPAVCYRFCPGWLVRHSAVLCPGSVSSARTLQYALRQRGETRLRVIFVPLSAEPLRGAERLLQIMPTGEMVFLGDSRLRGRRQPLSGRAAVAGTAVRTWPSGQGSTLGWSVDYRRSPGGRLDWRFSLPGQEVKVCLQWAESGEMKLRWQSPGQAERECCFPRSSRQIVWSSRE